MFSGSSASILTKKGKRHLKLFHKISPHSETFGKRSNQDQLQKVSWFLALFIKTPVQEEIWWRIFLWLQLDVFWIRSLTDRRRVNFSWSLGIMIFNKTTQFAVKNTFNTSCARPIWGGHSSGWQVVSIRVHGWLGPILTEGRVLFQHGGGRPSCVAWPLCPSIWSMATDKWIRMVQHRPW